MVALSLRGISSRKLRTFLTAFAVILGVALVSGTYMLTDTINRSFDNVFSTAEANVDVSVTPKRAFSGAAAQPLPASLVQQVAAVPGVAQASGGLSESGQIFNKHGKALVTGGAPMLINSAQPKTFSALNYVSGHAPAGPGQVALARDTANKGHFKLGDTVNLAGNGPQRAFRLVGIAKFGSQDSLAGAALAVVTLPEAQALLKRPGQVDTIDVRAANGVKPSQLVGRIRAALPHDVNVRTGQQQAARDATDLRNQLGFLRTILFVFAAIALFVGAFMIFNTFSITVAQRNREFALLRMIGASRRQVLNAVVVEAFLLGVLSSIVGFFAGFGLAPALNGLFKLFGADLPSSGLVFETRTVIVSLVIGTLVTLAAAVGPSVRATRVPPIAALQDVSSLQLGKTGRWRTPIAGVVAAIGLVLLLIGLFVASGTGAAGLVGAGAAVIFIGVGLLSSHLVRPLAAAVGYPLERFRGVSGRLARENAIRNPRRTASTAAALMIGVALVAFVTIFAAGLKASIANAVESGLKGSIVVEGSTGGQPVPAQVSGGLARVPGIGTVSALRFGTGQVAGAGKPTVTGVDPATVDRVFHVQNKGGARASLAAVTPTSAIVSQQWSKDHHHPVGSSFAMRTPSGRTLSLTVGGLFKDKAGLFGDVALPNSVLASDFGVQQDAVVAATTVPGADPDQVKTRVNTILKRSFPNVKALTKEGFKNEQADQVNQILALFYVMLSLSVIVSLFGIVNTLALSIHERTRELGMLRAIGTSRKQVRRVVRYESVITALIGAILGVVLGGIFAVLVTIPLRSQGFTISIPFGSLVALLVLAAIAGVVAAIGPARRAAKLDVLRALAYE